MSLWTKLRGKGYIRQLDYKPYRIVESQHYIATRKLVDSTAEQDVLESLIEESKPIAPYHNSRGNLDYLLFTPFRYPPLRDGTRFGRQDEQSIFYASLELETAMAEIAYRQLTHWNASDAKLTPTEVGFTNIQVHIKTNVGIQLTEVPFKKLREEISDPKSYAASQPLGAEMRGAGIEFFTFFSARASEGANVGLFSVEAFANNKPIAKGHWKTFISKERIEFVSADDTHRRYGFDWSSFSSAHLVLSA